MFTINLEDGREAPYKASINNIDNKNKFDNQYSNSQAPISKIHKINVYFFLNSILKYGNLDRDRLKTIMII